MGDPSGNGLGIDSWGGADASLLEQQLDGILASVDSLRTAAQVHLDCIPSADKALCDLEAFAFLVSHLLSAIGQHASAVVDLLHLSKILKELHT